MDSKLGKMLNSLEKESSRSKDNNDKTDPIQVYDVDGLPSKSLVFANMPRQCWKTFAVQCILHQRAAAYLNNLKNFNRMFTDEEGRLPSINITTNNVISGSGMIASRPIYNGKLIFAERPLMILPVLQSCNSVDKAHLDIAYRQMDGGKQNQYFELEDNCSEALDSSSSFKLGIWRTNAIRLQKFNETDTERENPTIYEAVGQKLSRINHSCDANCRVYFDVGTFTIQVRSTKYIPAGTEILRSYIMDGPWLASAAAGSQRQPSDIGFNCKCKSDICHAST